MTFKRWMEAVGLSNATATKYESAIKGSISKWAKDAGLISDSLKSIKNHEQFLSVAKKIQNLKVFQNHNERGNNMYSSALKKYSDYLANNYQDIEADIDDIINDANKTETEKSSLIKSRIGQGEFRSKLIKYWNNCAVTGYPDVNILIASHIKPWRVSNNNERLDHFNGLLLLPNLDAAFDSGLVTFKESGKIHLSDFLEAPSTIGIHSNMDINLDKHHQKYLKFHRENVFQSS